MKNLITGTACMMILLIFLLQFAQNQVLHLRVSAVDQQVNCFKEVIKQEGCISAENEKLLKGELVKILGCNEGEITVRGERKPIFRGGLIHYEVSVPIESIIASPGFWGIDDEQNGAEYTVSRYTTSEYIGR